MSNKIVNLLILGSYLTRLFPISRQGLNMGGNFDFFADSSDIDIKQIIEGVKFT
jgi:hypothetical protein